MLGSYEDELRKDRESFKIDDRGKMNEGQYQNQPAFHSYQPPPPFYWGQSQPPPTMPFANNPWPYNKPRHSIFTTVGITFGIIAMCIFWISIFPYNFGTVLLIVVVALAFLGIIFGILGYSRKKEDMGLVAFIISLVAVILSVIFWMFTHIPEFWVY